RLRNDEGTHCARCSSPRSTVRPLPRSYDSTTLIRASSVSCRYRSMLISRSPTASRSCTLPYSTHWPLAPLRNATSSSDAQGGVWVCIRRLYHGYADVL